MIRRTKGRTLQYFLYVICFVFSLTSCVTNKKITYLQDAADKDIPAYDVVIPEYYTIQPGDQIYIKVVPLDPEVRKSFSMDGGAASYSDMEAMLDLESYSVYLDGNIDYPMLGKIKMAGLTTRQARNLMDSLLIGTVFNEAEVTVKLVNNYVSLLGDVKRPGKYIIYKENLNIFQALAMGGDITSFGDRAEIKIVRQLPGKTYVKEFDLRSDEIINSEYYFVQPNDVIYVKRIKGQFFGINSFTNFVSLVSGSLAILSTSLLLWSR